MPSPKNPVLLVHGIDDTAQVFNRVKTYLRDRAWSDIHSLDLIPNNGDVGLDELAQQVQIYVDTFLADAPAIDLIGFSMGGIVSRYYVQRLGGARRVQRFVTISSPHNGTWMAYFRHNRGAAQMRPESSFLRELNDSVHELEQVTFTSLWTPYDLMIVPATSSLLPVGTQVRLPVLAHPLMLSDRRSLAAIVAALEAPPVTARTAQVDLSGSSC